MNKRVLLVDDDPNVLSGYQRNLRNRFQLDTAQHGEEAVAKLQANGPYAVIVADMQMPIMSGLDLLTKSELLAPDTVRMMLTGNADQKSAVDAVNRGHVFRFLNKPCPTESLVRDLEAGVKQYALVTAERELLERTLNGTIRLLTDVLASLYPEAFGHSDRVRNYVRRYAGFLKLQRSWDLESSALLAPVGYLTIPSSVILKSRSQAALTPQEQGLLERLPEIGAALLANIPRLEPVASIVRYQHKHYDGTGFPPENVAGDDIPIGARILKAINDLVLLEDETGDKARALLAMKGRHGLYDPRVLQSISACFDVDIGDACQPVIHACLLRDLKVGQILASPVDTDEGIRVAGIGIELTPIILNRLRNFAAINNIKEPIYVKG